MVAHIENLREQLRGDMWSWVIIAAVTIGAVVIYGVVSRVAPLLVGKPRRPGMRALFARTRRAVQLLIIAIIADSMLADAAEAAGIRRLFDRIVPLAVVFALVVIAERSVATLFSALRSHYDVSGPDNLRARRAQTQIIVLERVSAFAIVLIGIAIALMTIPEVRRYGTSLLASAGVVGLVIGIAAQPTIGNIVAGIQIAITQPLRIDDAVVVDGE